MSIAVEGLNPKAKVFVMPYRPPQFLVDLTTSKAFKKQTIKPKRVNYKTINFGL